MTGTRQLPRKGGSVNRNACLLAQASHRPVSCRHDSIASNRGALSQHGSSLTATDGSPVRPGRKPEDEQAAATWAYHAHNVHVTLCPTWATTHVCQHCSLCFRRDPRRRGGKSRAPVAAHQETNRRTSTLVSIL